MTSIEPSRKLISTNSDNCHVADYLSLIHILRTGKPITEEGENLADYVLDSIADLPRIAKRLIK